jgi:predicted transposase YbfD/YdcC
MSPRRCLAALDAWTDRRGRRVPPSLKTFRRVLRNLDAEASPPRSAWLRDQLLSGLADAAAVVVALDGKTVRGARARDGKAPHLLAAMICGTRAALAQKDVHAKTNEITQVKPLLDDVDIAGALVTADAMHIQKETARYLVEDKHADCLFTAVKDNQPSLFAALDALNWADAAVAHTMHDIGQAGTRLAHCRCCPPPEGCSRTLRRRS